MGEWKISTVKVPPVEGWRATSPREVENVERSSWAYCVCEGLVWLVLGARRAYQGWESCVFVCGG